MIIDHGHRLHEGIADGGAYEVEASTLQILTEGIRLGRIGGQLRQSFPSVDLQLSAPVAQVDILLMRVCRSGVIRAR